MNKSSKLDIFNHLIGAVPYRRRWQLLGLVCMQILSGFAELLGITAFVPLLQLLYDRSTYTEFEYLNNLTSFFDMSAENTLTIAAIAFGGLFCLANVIKFLTKWAELRFIAAIGNDLTVSVFNIIMEKPFIDIISKNSSVWIGRLTNDVNEYVGFLQSILFLANALIISSLVLTAIIAINPMAALVMTVSIAFVYIIFSLIIRKTLLKNGGIIARTFATRVRVIQESLTSLTSIILGGHRQHFTSKLALSDQVNRIKKANNSIYSASPRYALEIFGVIIAVSYLVLSTSNSETVATSIVTIGAFALAGARLLPLTQQIYTSFAGILSSYVPSMNIVSLLRSPVPELRPIDNDKILVKNKIALEAIFFSYPKTDRKQKNQVLNSVDMTIEANQITAIVGKSGGGKTTMLNILIGLLSPQRGKISIDGKDLSRKDIPSWQKSIALVPQTVLLIDDTIKRNIAFGLEDKSIDNELLQTCIKIAHLEEFIDALPNGVDTIVGEMGIEISGGERQRLGIARAIYCKPSVMFMDEATSALDIKTEKMVLTKLMEFTKTLTIVMIAHRPTTIKFANKVVMLSAGRVTNIISQEELKSNPDILQL